MRHLLTSLLEFHPNSILSIPLSSRPHSPGTRLKAPQSSFALTCRGRLLLEQMFVGTHSISESLVLFMLIVFWLLPSSAASLPPALVQNFSTMPSRREGGCTAAVVSPPIEP